jgi:hypothetical protein
MGVSPQLRPTDYASLEKVSDRTEREALYADNAIYEHAEPQGTRYTKGTHPHATRRSWQSLDAVLRSDQNSAAALPKRSLRLSRLFTALTVATGILTIAGVAASAREGLDLKDVSGPAGVLLGGGIATVGFGITGGIFYGRTRRGYERAVSVYNDSLAMRLGLNTPTGDYIPPQGVLLDADGFVILDERERLIDAPAADAEPKPAPVDTVAPPPVEEPLEPPPPAGDGPTVEPTPPPVVSPAEPAPSVPPPTDVVVPAPPAGGGGALAPADPLILLPSR